MIIALWCNLVAQGTHAPQVLFESGMSDLINIVKE